MVFELLVENGLGHFYDLGPQAGVRIGQPGAGERFRFLDDPIVRDRLVEFADDRVARVTFHLPAIHCIACVWLLENLFRLNPGIGRSTVNFPRRECTVIFEPARIRLSEVAALLTALGYEPSLHLGAVEERRTDPAARRLWLRLGVAGFAFGNTMLISVSSYLGLNHAEYPGLKTFLGLVSLFLAVPVLTYCASDYWRTAWLALRQRVITLDLPIAAGLTALFGQSCFEVLASRGDGYFDSLTGLVFFLLCGRLFQHKTYDRLAFDRDFKSFFPLSVRRRHAGREETVPLERVAVGDRLVLRHGELIPADARLVEGRGVIDYSFVTGEAVPVEKVPGEHLYAGGKQLGATVEIETVKPVSQSYLTSLWSHEAFRKERQSPLDTLTNRFSRRFTVNVVLVAVVALLGWTVFGQGARGLKAFISVLIVACPCALALAAPFALGTAQRLLARRHIFLRDPQVIEALGRIRSIVFDKTGTLTTPDRNVATFHGDELAEEERVAVAALASHSTHPYAVRIAAALASGPRATLPPNDGARTATSAAPEAASVPVPRPVGTASAPRTVSDYREAPGAGIEGDVNGQRICLGSAGWLTTRGITMPSGSAPAGPTTHLAIAGRYRGQFTFASVVRAATGPLLARLGAEYELALLSGDSEAERARFRGWFRDDAQLHFHQSPRDKLGFIRQLQQAGKRVMMVGDGLNDAGALKQSEVGVAVVENLAAFTPASDVILDAAQVQDVPALLNFSRATVQVVYASFAISIFYNAVGLSIAAWGKLSPLVCAILMPLSSITVVAFACGLTRWMGRRAGFTNLAASPTSP